jgi:hypothetical protein
MSNFILIKNPENKTGLNFMIAAKVSEKARG